jgi:MFS family permease
LNRLPIYVGVALVSASVLALQVIFTRIFSIMIWHHFTYLIVGVALLGGGAAGVFLAVRRWKHEVIRRRLGVIALAFSLSTLMMLAIVSFVHFDPLRMNDLPRTVAGLAIYFAGLFTTFTLGGLVIAGAFSVWSYYAHRLYFADLLGAGVATLAVIWVVHTLSAPSAIILVALLSAAAALLFGVKARWRWLTPALLVGQAILLIASLVQPIYLPVPESKPLHWALQASGADRPEYMRWNPVARVDVTPAIEVDEPMIVGGVSQRYFANRPEDRRYRLNFVTLDGTSMTGLFEFDGDLSKFAFLQHAIISAPYLLSKPEPTTLLVGVGGGIDILLARLHDARRIVAIDLNSDVVDLVVHHYADFTGNLATGATEVLTAEGRNFLTSTTEQFDVIQGIGLDNIAALNTGAYVLSESYLYTVEAFDLALDRLTPEGVFSWTRAATDPPIETLRLVGLAAEALRQRGISDPAAHIVVVENDNQSAINLLVSPSPFSAAQVERLEDWAGANGFPVLHDPFTLRTTAYAAYLNAENPRAFEEAYPFNIYPVTDDHPFYYNYFKWDRLLEGGARTGNLSARVPMGNIILLTMLVFTLIVAAVFVMLPLWRNQRAGLATPNAGKMLTYFSALGLAYMFVQIVLIQRFTLFIGYPTLAITTTIFSMLVFSACGSLVGQRLFRVEARLPVVILIVSTLIALYVFVMPPIFSALLGLPDTARVVVSILMIAPLAFFMGMPFPTGIRAVGQRTPELVPWAWGMNGVFSVLGSTAVIIVSMFSSFTISLAAAALIYAVAAMVAPALRQTRKEEIYATAYSMAD